MHNGRDQLVIRALSILFITLKKKEMLKYVIDKNMDKRVYIVCTSLDVGGSELQASRLANSLSEIGYETVFVSLKKAGDLKHELSSTVKFYDYKLYRKSRTKKFVKIRTFLWLIIGIINLRKELSSNNGQNVIISFLFHASLVSFLVSILNKNTHQIVTVRSDRFAIRTKKTSFFRTTVMKIVFRFSSHIVFNSNKSKEAFVNKSINKVGNSIIHNLLPDRSIEIKERKFNTEQLNGIYVGRLDKLKNIDSLIYAIGTLRKEKIAVSLDIYGSGKEEKSLKGLVEDLNLEECIKFKEKEIGIIGKSIHYDFLGLTSFHEGFPNVVIEAMKNTLLVVSTDVGDVKELLSDNRGIIANETTVESIAAAIRKASSLSNDEKKSIVIRAQQFIDGYLDRKEILNQWTNLINNI